MLTRALPLGRLGGRRARRSDGRSERGQAAFEFLLILPLFVLFILLLIDFGIVMYGYVSVSNAAREGARYASVGCQPVPATPGCTLAEIQDRTSERSSGFLAPGDVTVSRNGLTRGASVAVTATRDHAFLFVPASIDISSCAAMRFERDDPGTLPAGSGGGSCSP